jgi:hypothetical protein
MIILGLLCVGIGILIGITLVKQNQKNIPVSDAALLNRLSVAENLNTSLKKDLNDAKEQLWKLQRSNDSDVRAGNLK